MVSPMRRVNEVMSQDMGNYLTNFKSWNPVAYNVLEYKVVGGGVVDDTAALQALVDRAISEGRKAIYFPAGEYYVTALTNADQVVFFGDNASFVGGYTGTIYQMGDWATNEQLADKTTVSIKDYEKLKVPIADGYDWSPCLNKANEELSLIGGGEIFCPLGTYLFADSVKLMSNIRLTGEGAATILKLAANSSEDLYDPVNGRLWFHTDGENGVIVDNVCFDANGSNQSSTFRTFTVLNSSNFKISNVQFKDDYGSSLNFLEAETFEVNNITFTNIKGAVGNPGEGIYIFKGSNGTISNVIGNSIDDHLIYIDGDSTGSSEDITVSNIIGINCGRDTSSGASGSTFNVVGNSKRVRLSNCQSYNSAQGFRVKDQNSMTPEDISLSNCTSHITNRSSDAHGFAFISAINTPFVMRLKLDGCKAYRSGNLTSGIIGYGFYFYGLSDVTVTGIESAESNDSGVIFLRCKNVVWNGGLSKDNSKRRVSATDYGVIIGDSTVDNACSEVYISDVSTMDTASSGKLQNYGVYIRNNCTNVVVTGGRHVGNAGGSWLRDAATDPSCIFVDIPQTGILPMRSYATGMPTSGTYKQNDIVWNVGTDTSILLWKRLTTGNGHVLNTDWKVY